VFLPEGLDLLLYLRNLLRQGGAKIRRIAGGAHLVHQQLLLPKRHIVTVVDYRPFINLELKNYFDENEKSDGCKDFFFRENTNIKTPALYISGLTTKNETSETTVQILSSLYSWILMAFLYVPDNSINHQIWLKRQKPILFL